MNLATRMLPEPRGTTRESLLNECICLPHNPYIFLDVLNGPMIASLMLRVFGWGRMTEKRLMGLLAMVLGLIAGLLMLSGAVGHGADLIGIVAGIGVLYGSYLIFRGKTSLLFGWAKTRMGAFINLAIGVATLLVPGGLGGTPSILAIASGILALVAA